jgi:FkbM family methyltransferase
MVGAVLKRIAARMPGGAQQELRRLYFRSQIRRHRFLTDEREYALLDTWLGKGDWALDVGANVGHYTLRMSEIVGEAGRVIAFEPVPDTFALLAANSRLSAHSNVTLLNVAASDEPAVGGMQIPKFDDGLPNYYQARVSGKRAALNVLALPIDALALPARVALVKMDVEGHELAALRGMAALIERDHPVLIVETASADTEAFLRSRGYAVRRIPGSSNVVCTAAGGARSECVDIERTQALRGEIA